ncbi:peptidyl-prolyl cis-trans isomerase [Burkholderia sp. MR1-5-21]
MRKTIDKTGGLTSGVHDPHRAQTRRSLILFACGALVGLGIAGYGLLTAKDTSAVPPEAMALVNGRPILRSDFETQVHTQFGVAYARSTPDQRRRVLDDMIAEELNVQRGVELDLPSSDPDVRAAMVSGVELEVTANVLAQRPSQEQLRAWYESHKAKYASDASMRMRDLVARTGPQRDAARAGADAAQAVAALRAGRPLEQVMHSFGLEDSGRVDTDTILDFAARAKLDAPVYAAASRLAAGAVSDPVDAADGAHVVVMIEHHASVQQAFDTVSNRVGAEYDKEAQEQVLRSNVQFLRGRADVQLSNDAKALPGTARHQKEGV